MEIALSQCGPTSDRQLAIIDKNRDLYLTPIKHIGPAERLVKLGEFSTNLFDLPIIFVSGKMF